MRYIPLGIPPERACCYSMKYLITGLVSAGCPVGLKD